MKQFSISKISKTVFVTAILVCTVSHMFYLTNDIRNHDSVYVDIGLGTTLSSGRFTLHILSETILPKYDIPYINSLIALLFLTLVARLVVYDLDIQKVSTAVAITGLLLTYPSIAMTLTFSFSSVSYSLAILITVLASIIVDRRPWTFLLSAFLVAISMGIYQAYVPIFASLLLIKLIKLTISDSKSWPALLKQSLKYLASIILAFVLYFILLQIALNYYGGELSAYKGINQISQLTFVDILSRIKTVYSYLLSYLTGNVHGLTLTKLLNRAYLGLYLVFGLSFIHHAIRSQSKLKVLYTAFLSLLVPLASQAVVVMSGEQVTNTLMVYAFAYLPIFIVYYVNAINQKFQPTHNWLARLPQITHVIILLIVASYSWLNNYNYYSLYNINEYAENYFNRLFSQIQMTPSYESGDEIILVGEFNESGLNTDPFSDDNRFAYSGMPDNLVAVYSNLEFIQQINGIESPVTHLEDAKPYQNDKRIQNLPCYPDQASIIKLDGKIIVKLSPT